MSRDWKPGDMARLTLKNGVVHPVAIRLPLHEGGWATGASKYVHSVHVADASPLVVINPEQIPHLSDFGDDPTNALRRIADDVRDVGRGDLDATEEIIRWLADLIEPTPPKPDEPQGLGAVVEDAEGADWHRTREGRWIAEDGLRSRACGWDHIEAVRILSGGVA